MHTSQPSSFPTAIEPNQLKKGKKIRVKIRISSFLYKKNAILPTCIFLFFQPQTLYEYTFLLEYLVQVQKREKKREFTE